MMQLTNGQPACMLVFMLEVDILSILCDYELVFCVLYELSGCLTVLEILEIYWNNFSLLEILEIYCKLAKSPGNFLADSKFLYFTVYRTSKTFCCKPGLIDIGAISPR